jgi:hypothetical protein
MSYEGSLWQWAIFFICSKGNLWQPTIVPLWFFRVVMSCTAFGTVIKCMAVYLQVKCSRSNERKFYLNSDKLQRGTGLGRRPRLACHDTITATCNGSHSICKMGGELRYADVHFEPREGVLYHSQELV